MMTLSLFHGLKHVPNAHTGKLTPGSGTWGVAPRNPFFLVHSGGVRAHLRGLQVTVTRMVGKLTVPDDIQGWM